MTIFLIGYMGCGKSTIGRRVAGLLGWRFVDMDGEIERRAGMTIGEMFDRCGEAFFRERERETLASLGEDKMVVATGGGVPCHGDNMERMNRHQTVYLRLSPAKLFSRLEHGRSRRPLIRDLDDRELRTFIEEKLSEREPFYAGAKMVIDCDAMSDESVARHIAEHVGKISK